MRRLKKKKTNFFLLVRNSGVVPEQTLCLIENMDVIDEVVCVNKTTYKLMRTIVDNSTHNSSVAYIPNGVPEKVFNHRISDGVFRIGYARRLDDNKRARDILIFWKIIKRLKNNIELWIAGSGDVEDEFIKLADKENNVRFYGRLKSGSSYEVFYPNIDIFDTFFQMPKGLVFPYVRL